MMVYNRSLLAELDTTELENAVCEICDKADDFDSADVCIKTNHPCNTYMLKLSKLSVIPLQLTLYGSNTCSMCNALKFP